MSAPKPETHLLDLLGELACGGQHERLALLEGDVDLLQYSDREGGSLAGAGLRLGNHVVTCATQTGCKLRTLDWVFFLDMSSPFMGSAARKLYHMLVCVLCSSFVTCTRVNAILFKGGEKNSQAPWETNLGQFVPPKSEELPHTHTHSQSHQFSGELHALQLVIWVVHVGFGMERHSVF